MWCGNAEQAGRKRKYQKKVAEKETMHRNPLILLFIHVLQSKETASFQSSQRQCAAIQELL